MTTKQDVVVLLVIVFLSVAPAATPLQMLHNSGWQGSTSTVSEGAG